MREQSATVQAVDGEVRTLSELESMELLAPFGVSVPQHVLVRDPAELEVLTAALGFPLVAKLCGSSIAHKTERGLVRLRIGDDVQLRRAVEELRAVARPEDGDTAVLVAQMLSGSRELIAGVATDDVFGASVMLGVGGILAEAIEDVVLRLVPLTRVDAGEMIDDLGAQALLGPFRGEPGVDREALIDVLVALSDAAEAIAGLGSIDLNPLILVDGRPVAVDALVVMRDTEVA